MIENTRPYKILGFALIVCSGLIDLVVHLSGFDREIVTSVHFMVFIPFVFGVLVLLVTYLKAR